MTIDSYIVIFVIIFLAGLVQSSTGFGFSIISMSLLPFMIQLKTASVIVITLVVINTVYNTLRLRKYINLSLIIPPIAASLMSSAAGMFFLSVVSPLWLKGILGALLIFLSIYLFFFKMRFSIKGTARNGIIAGLVSGLLGGMYNIDGPPLVLYFMGATERKEGGQSSKNEYVGSLQSAFTVIAVYRIIIHLSVGNMVIDHLKIILPGIPVVLAGSVLGLRFLKKIDKQLLSRIVYLFMMLSGIILLIEPFIKTLF
jgi:uncharacterized protein